LVIEQEDRVILVDAKYKDRWEELRQHRWLQLEEEIRERHREDLLQVFDIPIFGAAGERGGGALTRRRYGAGALAPGEAEGLAGGERERRGLTRRLALDGRYGQALAATER
jgi:hypothetical protein